MAEGFGGRLANLHVVPLLEFSTVSSEIKNGASVNPDESEMTSGVEIKTKELENKLNKLTVTTDAVSRVDVSGESGMTSDTETQNKIRIKQINKPAPGIMSTSGVSVELITGKSVMTTPVKITHSTSRLNDMITGASSSHSDLVKKVVGESVMTPTTKLTVEFDRITTGTDSNDNKRVNLIVGESEMTPTVNITTLASELADLAPATQTKSWAVEEDFSPDWSATIDWGRDEPMEPESFWQDLLKPQPADHNH